LGQRGCQKVPGGPIPGTWTFFEETYGSRFDTGILPIKGSFNFTWKDTGRFWTRASPEPDSCTTGAARKRPWHITKAKQAPNINSSPSKKTIGGSLKKWLRSKGKPESLDYVTRRSVHARGIRPRRFFSDVFEQELVEFDFALNEAATMAVEESLDEILEPLKQ
jgi:hypothetical protein